MGVGSGSSLAEPYWNNFGAQATQLPSYYPGTQLEDYDENDGVAVITDALARASERIVNAMPPLLYNAIAKPTLVYCELRATAGQAAVQIPWGTAMPQTMHVWYGYPQQFINRPRTMYEVNRGDSLCELAPDQFNCNYNTGAIALNIVMPQEAQILVSYLTNVSNILFAIPSLSRIALRGAAAELGARLYSDGEQYVWGLVKRYQDDFDRDVKQISEGALVPPEVRALTFWEAVQPKAEDSGRAGSVRIWRAL